MKEIRLLYIEDELHLGKIVKETLEKQGYEVAWESDGAKVLNHFQSFDPQICVLDIMLPHVDGYELCKRFLEYKIMMDELEYDLRMNISFE